MLFVQGDAEVILQASTSAAHNCTTHDPGRTLSLLPQFGASSAYRNWYSDPNGGYSFQSTRRLSSRSTQHQQPGGKCSCKCFCPYVDLPVSPHGGGVRQLSHPVCPPAHSFERVTRWRFTQTAWAPRNRHVLTRHAGHFKATAHIVITSRLGGLLLGCRALSSLPRLIYLDL